MTETLPFVDPRDPDIRESTVRRERKNDGHWVCYEPYGSEVKGHGDTEHEAVIDYIERLREGQA